MTSNELFEDIEAHKIDLLSVNNKPMFLYVGRKQVSIIQQWLYDRWRTSSPKNSIAGEGLSRTELSGLKVYCVNSDDHLTVG